jgi:hypothetical protein
VRKHVLLLALVVVSVAVWVASASAAGNPKVFSLLAVDNGKGQPINGFMFDRAPSAGDSFPISEDLYTWAGAKRGARVGSDHGSAMFLVVANKGAHSWTVFNVQANLPGGTILVSGVAPLTNGPSRFTLAVTGGTGKYANAHGYVTVRGMAGNKTNLDFNLNP